jgi:hypothetical protein
LHKADRHAHALALDLADTLSISLKEIGEFAHAGAALGTSERRPFPLEGSASRGHGGIDILSIGDRNVAKKRVVRGIVHSACLGAVWSYGLDALASTIWEE